MGDLLRSIGFLTVLAPPSRQANDLGRLARSFWWSVPLVEAVCTTMLAGACILLRPHLSVPVIAVFFVAADHLAHGLRRLDGFSDLGEAILFLRSNPQKTRSDAWQVVRAGANGPYGTALIVLALGLHIQLAASLLQRGRGTFFVGVLAAALFSKLGVAVALAAPGRFRPASDFGGFAATLATPVRVGLLAAVATVATLGAAFVIEGVAPVQLVVASVVVAAATGLASRALVVRSLGELNGDLLGLAWVTSELALLTTWLVSGGGPAA